MMKELYLLVLEDEKPVRKPLAEIDFDTLDFAVDEELYHRYWGWTGDGVWVCFEPEQLIRKYLETVETVHTLFRPLFAENTTFPLDDKIKSVGMTFAGYSAYNTLWSDNPNKVDAIAHYCTDEGIFQRIGYRSLDKVGHDSIHEFGHAMDDLLNSVNYKQRTPTMREVMAIFVEETVGISEYYLTKPHRQAKEILRCLAHTRFSLLDFPEQWEFLNGITDEKDIPAQISSSFPPERPLIKLLDTITSFGKSIGINSK